MAETIARKQYDTGNGMLDNARKRVFQTIDDCIELASGDGAREELALRLSEAYRHIASHFRSEELMMDCLDVAQYESHISAHNRILDNLKAKIERFVSAEDGTASARGILLSLREWYLFHSVTEDRKLAGLQLEKQTSLPQAFQACLPFESPALCG